MTLQNFELPTNLLQIASFANRILLYKILYHEDMVYEYCIKNRGNKKCILDCMKKVEKCSQTKMGDARVM